ncbi:MAG: hypothetical protein LBL13_13515 [Bacteroidales bacterium]|jgi:hypothetical protein|nr:hypothetical protein [Bacteroidales bacterium]
MELKFKEEDVEILDNMLGYMVKEDKLLSKEWFIKDKVLPRNTSDEDYKNYVYVISSYCAEIKKEGFNGFYIKPNEKTANFYKNGGFKGFYERKMKEAEECDEFKALHKKYLELQNEKAEYEKTIRKQNDTIRRWKFWATVLAITSTILGLIQIFCK